MTAAHAEESAQEKRSKKSEKKEREEEDGNAPEEVMTKVATGGQSTEEVTVIDNCGSMNDSTRVIESTDAKKEDAPDPPPRSELHEDQQENRSQVKIHGGIENKSISEVPADLCSPGKPVPETDASENVDRTGESAEENEASEENSSDTPRLQELRRVIEMMDEEKRSEYEVRGCNAFDISCDSNDSYDPESELNFHEAVRTGDAKCVLTLLASGSVRNLDEPDWNVSGDPPLLVAATNHCLPVLSALLANGCDPAVRSPRGETALHRVILNGGPGNVLKFVGELLKYGCPPGVKEAGGGLTALHVLTRQLAHAQGSKNLHHNFEAALKTLDLLAKAGPVNAKDHQGRSALHILASSTIFDNNHRTEIESLIETLLSAGADPALKNDRGETPLHECLECGALNTAFLLIPHTPTGITSRYGETPLHIASRKNYADIVAKLLEQGEDPGVQDAGGNTPLHLASARGFHQTVSLLVTSPLAQLEKLNGDGLTALQVAAESGFVNAVKLLLKAGADPSQTVHYCATTLHRHPDISVLIDHELTRRRQLAA